MLLVILSSISIGIADAISKYAVSRLKTGRLMIISGSIQLLLNLTVFIVMKGHFPTGTLFVKVFFLQMISSAAYLVYIIALMYGPVSVLVAILSASSVFSVVLGRIVLHEIPTTLQYVAITLVIAGSIAISFEKRSGEAPVHSKKSIWLTFAILATVLWGVWAFLSKVVLSEIKPYELTFFNSTLSPIFLLPYLIYSLKSEKDVKMTFKPVMAAIIFAVLVGTGLLLFYFAATKVPISLASPIFCTSPLYTAVVSAIFFKERLQKHQYVALVVIIGSLFLF